jgi:hypothetical protein
MLSVLNFSKRIMAHSFDQGFKTNLHTITLLWSTVGILLMILLLWQKFEYKFSKMLSGVCFDLSLWWHLPN